MKFFVITGEPSGDKLGAEIFKVINNQLDKIKLKGVGGSELEKLNIENIFPQKDINLMGFAEILPVLPRIIARINFTVKEIIKEKPDIIITIDAPDFNFRVINKLKKIGYNNSKIIHIVAPTVWAYREYRAKKIANLYDKLLVLLPFEPPYFLKYGLDTKFIGHPLLDKKKLLTSDLHKKYNITKKEPLIVITLGSRKQEVARFLPIIIKSLNLFEENNIHATIIFPTNKRFNNQILEHKEQIKQKFYLINDEEEKYYFYKYATIAIAKSGTNNLEIASFSVPIITYYSVNFITYLILKLLVKTKFVNLINIMAKKEVIPELIQNHFSEKHILNNVKFLWNNKKLREEKIKQQNFYLEKFKVENENSSLIAAKEILNII
ncbi:MAG: lipid-A-disaccharide synthase [Rickettsiales bacterium]|nr:lipid-A-disaccharide synthase [Rickettsiales bacterium]